MLKVYLFHFPWPLAVCICPRVRHELSHIKGSGRFSKDKLSGILSLMLAEQQEVCNGNKQRLSLPI